jgi:hypothetical protein
LQFLLRVVFDVLGKKGGGHLMALKGIVLAVEVVEVESVELPEAGGAAVNE